MKIVLVGFMCSGKTRVGRLLAKRLGWPHHDTDAMVVQKHGAPVAEIIRTEGEQAFRELERNAVREAGQMDRVVVSTGGGAPLNKDNWTDLSRDATVIWLRVKPETVLKRAGDLKSRPLIDPKNPLESIRRRMEERAAVYSQAHYVFDGDSMEAQDVVEKIIPLLKL